MQTTSSETVQTTQPAAPATPSPQNPPRDGITIGRPFLINISALTLAASFFLPWVTVLGKGLTGLDIQRNFSSYQLVWVLPVLALLALVLNAARVETKIVRRVAGAAPFLILGYAINQLGNDVLQIIAPGGWVALVSGAVLSMIPNAPKQQPKG